MRKKSLTQDVILHWGFTRRKNMNMMCCLLCYADNDSHSHLFFECKFSSQVWSIIRQKVGMDNVNHNWENIVSCLLVHAKSKSAANYVSRILVAATAYFIWQERNARLFKNQLRPPETICAIIFNTVRYKLMGVKLKKTDNVRRLLGEWEIRDKDIMDDGG
ncbi:uncharacterized protein LOC110907684 [Helianthus annuus]|uniref:uncharacterized protein LOC110907684 n=1 Tax=Helianthus annuus TaxID=4232 RepID=UPI000B8FE77D|nr:uncharacterized protein LOC110907684 [Helianthus annuus]